MERRISEKWVQIESDKSTKKDAGYTTNFVRCEDKKQYSAPKRAHMETLIEIP